MCKMPGSNYAAMTVNERLFVAGLLNDWDKATNLRDEQQAITILTSVELSVDQARETVQAVLANLQKYGYERWV